MSIAHIGYIMPQTQKDKISKANKGRRPKNFEEAQKKAWESNKGRVPWNKGKKLSEKHRERLSISHIGKTLSQEQKEKIKLANTGRRMSGETKKKLSLSLRKHYSVIPKKEYRNCYHSKDTKYNNWRISVFERDNYTCQICGQRGGELCAHHVLSWSEYPKLRFILSNGITYCYSCHRFIHKKKLAERKVIKL